MPRPSITPEKKAEMRKRIREATSRVVQRHKLNPGDARGYEAITIREVATEAGISVGTFYKYFSDRSDLAQSLWSEPVEKLKKDMQAAYESATLPVDKLRVLLQHYIQFSVDHRRVFRGAFLFVRADEAPKPESLPLEKEVFYVNLKQALEDGQKLGHFRDFNSRQMAQIFWAAIHGSLALPENLDRYQFDSPEAIAKNMIDELVNLVIKPA